jgi:hypothetical protein
MAEIKKIKPAVASAYAPSVTIVHFDEEKKKESKEKESITDGK